MNSFDFYSPTYFAFGKDREQDAGALVRRFGGTKVLIHYGGGYGLRRMEMITGKYDGHAWFSFDAENRVFVTRLMLPVSEV